MKKLQVVVITDSHELSESLCRYVKQLMAAECYQFTYENTYLLSQEIISKTDIIILDLIRNYSSFIRAEGIYAGETFYRGGKKVLIINCDTLCYKIDSPIYWDNCCDKSLKEKIVELCNSELQKSDSIIKETFEILKKEYHFLLRDPSHHSHKR